MEVKTNLGNKDVGSMTNRCEMLLTHKECGIKLERNAVVPNIVTQEMQRQDGKPYTIIWYLKKLFF